MMQGSIETLVCFLELLEIQPPILQDQDKSSLTELFKELERLNLDQIQQAADYIREWGGDHEQRLDLYDQAKMGKSRKELDEIDPDPHKDRWIIPNFQLEISEEVRILIIDPPKSSEDCPVTVSPESSENCPVKVPILDYVKQILSKLTNKLR
jgi:hypothetical protein